MVKNQIITDNYCLYNGDCVETLAAMPDESIHLSIYSPPFSGLYHYSSSPRDLSNCDNYDQFVAQYDFVIKELSRVTMAGRITAVHCCDVPLSNTGCDVLKDFPGDIVRLHKSHRLEYIGRHCVWKEPLAVRNRTMQKNLAHQTIVEDASLCSCASADYVLLFRKQGDNKTPVVNTVGLTEYYGERTIPAELQQYQGWTGKQTENRYSHWIWRQYASSFWDDVRGNTGNESEGDFPSGVLPFEGGRDEDDEKHVHPLQLDIIRRIVVLRSNPGEIVFTPFMGVGSEVYGAVELGRKGVGVELKESYFKQAVKNVATALRAKESQVKLDLL